MPEYDLSFDPPAPVVPVQVMNRPRGKTIQIRAQIDTGRDILQHFILTLDGKASQFTLVDP